MDAAEEGVVRAVMVESSAGVIMEVTSEADVEVTVAVVCPIPGHKRHVEVERCRAAAV